MDRGPNLLEPWIIQTGIGDPGELVGRVRPNQDIGEGYDSESDFSERCDLLYAVDYDVGQRSKL